MGIPFPVEKIQQAAEDYLHRERFEKARIIWNPVEEGHEFSLSDSDSDDDDSDDDIRAHVTKLFKKKERKQDRRSKLAKRNKAAKEESSTASLNITAPASKPRNKSSDQTEVESLIKQMSRLSINDPTYSLLYYQAMKLDQDVAHVLATPVQQRATQAPAANRDTQPRNPNSSFPPRHAQLLRGSLDTLPGSQELRLRPVLPETA